MARSSGREHDLAGAGTPAGDAGYAQDEAGLKPGDKRPEHATAVERAASKPGAVPEAVPVPDAQPHDDPGVNPTPGGGG